MFVTFRQYVESTDNLTARNSFFFATLFRKNPLRNDQYLIMFWTDEQVENYWDNFPFAYSVQSSKV